MVFKGTAKSNQVMIRKPSPDRQGFKPKNICGNDFHYGQLYPTSLIKRKVMGRTKAQHQHIKHINQSIFVCIGMQRNFKTKGTKKKEETETLISLRSCSESPSTLAT
jgi:hypothetical protein